MWHYLRAHSIALGLLILSSAYFVVLTAPGLTWINTNCDGAVYLRSAKYAVLSHPWGAPLFNMIDWLVVRIPVGDEAWRLAMVSAICAVVTTMILYALARRMTRAHSVALLAPGIWMASTLVLSQATIIETYSMTVMLAVAAYYCHVSKKDTAKYLLLAAGVAVHHLIMFVLLVVVAHDIIRHHWRWHYLLLLLGLLPYGWVVLVNAPPYYWIEGGALAHYVSYFFSQGGLIGGLPVWEPDTVVRLQDFALLLLPTFGAALLLIPAVKGWRSHMDLVLLTVAPVAYYVTNLAPQTYVYMMAAVPFAALLAVAGAKRLYVAAEWGMGVDAEARRPDWSWLPGIALFVCGVLMVANGLTMDIGRTLDPQLQARQFYQRLDTLPKDSTLWIPKGGWFRATVWLYDSDNNTNLRALPVYGYPSEWNIAEAKTAMAEDSLYMLVMTDPRQHLVDIRLAMPSDIDAIMGSSAKLEALEQGECIPIKPQWVNPWMLVQGRYEVERWGYATSSDITMGLLMFFAACAVGGGTIGERVTRRKSHKVQILSSYAGAAAGIILALVIGMAMGLQIAV